MSGNPFLRPGRHWDPYKRTWCKNLTEAEVQKLWPYAKKEAPKVEPVHDWLEETLQREGLVKTQKDTLTEVPDRSGPMPPMADVEWPIQMELFETAAQVNNLLEMVDSLEPSDMVALPKHYARFKFEPIRFICENNLNFFQGNIIKYVLRHDAKNGLEDLKKARRYLDMFIKFVEGDEDWWRK